MIARVRPVQGRLTGGVGGPIEIAAVDDDATDAGAVATDVFSGGMHDDRGAVVERADEQAGGGVVHDQRDAERPADGGDLGDREDL